jgi:hypothetical protein
MESSWLEELRCKLARVEGMLQLKGFNLLQMSPNYWNPTKNNYKHTADSKNVQKVLRKQKGRI